MQGYHLSSCLELAVGLGKLAPDHQGSRADNGPLGLRRLSRGFQGVSLVIDSWVVSLAIDSCFRPKIGFFIVKSIFEIVKMIRRKFPKFSYM